MCAQWKLSKRAVIGCGLSWCLKGAALIGRRAKWRRDKNLLKSVEKIEKEDWPKMERGDFPSSQGSDLSLNETRSAGGEGTLNSNFKSNEKIFKFLFRSSKIK